MPFYYFIYAVITLTCLLLLIRYFVMKRYSLPTRLFQKGLQAENNGNYQEATISYENALAEAKKLRFQSILEKKIIEKLKVLNMVTEYQNEQNFIRENNAWIR